MNLKKFSDLKSLNFFCFGKMEQYYAVIVSLNT